eukprot:TRINITY_DN3530_c0_g1_i2.p1 TRINITY_DN3530_c0_g1~~TRINITY_DN3530_c0_g1_i2.p1  ORF type:complete len:263 (+),score=28.95 TRINITY_DN3530_c0_g1_i2:46-789(+)
MSEHNERLVAEAEGGLPQEFRESDLVDDDDLTLRKLTHLRCKIDVLEDEQRGLRLKRGKLKNRLSAMYSKLVEFAHMHDDVLDDIIQHLNPGDLLKVELVSKQWRRVVEHRWKDLILRDRATDLASSRTPALSLADIVDYKMYYWQNVQVRFTNNGNGGVLARNGRVFVKTTLQCLPQTQGLPSWHAVASGKGYSSGRHYFEVQITRTAKSQIMIGALDLADQTTLSKHIGYNCHGHALLQVTELVV